MSAKILDIFSGRRSESNSSPVEVLTDREFQFFQLIGKGQGTTQIAVQLHLSAKTVEGHRIKIKEKLKIEKATELIHFATQWMQSELPTG